MSRFLPLQVTDIRRDTRDAVVVTLRPRPEDAGSFDFTQGQYLTFRRDFDGEELRRSYSICAGRDEGFLRVGIKRVDGGAFSTWANEELAPGMMLDAMPPMGRFFAEIDPAAARHYLGFAGGSGITIQFTDYNASTGELLFNANSSQVIDIPAYIRSLQNCGVFSTVSYTGYKADDDGYSIDLRCVLAAPQQ